MTIYNSKGNVILEAPVTKEAIIKYVLMEDYYIELPFYSNKLRKFPRGSYILHKGRKFEIMSVVRPEYQSNTGGYKYTLKFEAQQSHMKRRKVFWLKSTNAETSFHDTTFLADFGQLIADNMNRFLGGENWKVAAVPSDLAETAKLVSFNGDFCWDALNRIAETFECEWWTVDNGTEVWIYFGKLEFGTPEQFERGKVVTSIPAKKGDDSNYGTRFYIFGSSRNLPDDYDPTEQGGITNHVSEKRLHLPNGMQYIDAWDNIEQADIVEQVAFFDDIFPKNTETVTSVTTIPRKVENTDDPNATFDAYVVYCADTPFLPSDIYEGETLMCKFTSGSLNGREFELAIIDNNNDNIDPEKWKPEDGFNKKFEIIADVEQIGEDNVLTIPNESLHPEPEDTFVLTGVKLPQERITEAENELLEVGKAWAKKNSSDTDVYDCPTNPVYCQRADKNYELGQKVVLIDDRFGDTGRQSRIQGFEKKLWNEYEATYTVGDNASYSRLGSIETTISESAYAERIGVVSGVGIYLIRSKYDATQPTDYNAYSALATEALFLNKRKGGTVAGDIAIGGKIITTDFRAGLIGGAGLGIYKDENGNTVVEADRFNVRQEMQVNTLVINQAEGRGGMEIDTAAFIHVTRVVDTSNGYICYFDQKDGSVANLFHIDDVAFCNQWTPENTELKFYKRRVTAVSIDNITLSKTEVNGTGIPMEKDTIIHFGNYTDKTRQYVKVRDVVGGGYERYLDGLDSVNAQGNEYYFVGKQNGLYNEKPRWFIGNKDGEYAEWVDGKLNIKGSISVQSTIGGDKIDEYIKKVSPPVEQEDIEGFVNNIVDPKITGLQNQIDGVIETWFANGVPTMTNYPANGWNTDALKIQHLGDLYYDNTTGTAYRFSQNAQGGYYWNTITDDAITKALAAAKAAQDTADGKRRIFTSRPTPPYDKGDLWVNAIYGSQYNDDILRCDTAKASGEAFVISDWVLSSKYTDDTLAQAAEEAARAAQTTANEAKSVADAAKTRLDSWAADGVISPTEKQGIKDEIARIDSDKAHIAAEYIRYDLGTSTTYNDAYAAYRAQLVSLSALSPENIAIPTDFADKQSSYYNERTTALGAIAAAAKKYADAVAKKEADEAVKGYKYLKEALKDVTTIAGGLMLSSQIRLGSHNADFTTQTTWSGMNGIYTKPRDIASWYGGNMLDLFNDDDTRKELAANDRPAASLIRMDGSAYFAKGNIGFRADGSGWLGNDVTGIKFSNTGVMTFGSGISFDVSNVSGLNNTLDTLAKFNASLTTLLSPCDANDNEISWAEATMSDNAGGIKAKSLKAKVGLWSVEFVSALGKNDNEGGGGIGATALAQLTDVSLSTPLNGDVLQFNGQKWVNVAMPTIRPDLTDYVTLNTAQTITAAKTFESIVYRKTNTLTRTLFNSDTGYDYLIFGDTAGYTYLRGSTIGFQNSLGKTNVTISNDGVLTAVKMVKVGGTASQILMADGSVKDFTNMASPYLAVQDVRGEVRLPSYFPAYKVSAWFNSTGTPKGGSWYSGILVKGWADNYASWEIAASAHSPINDENLYFRNGINSTWGGWRKILDEKNYASILDDHYVKKTDSIIAAYAGAVRDPEHYTISTRRGSANINFNNDAGLRHFLATSSMMVGKPMNDGHIIHMEWDNSLSWAAQIAVPNSSSASMQWRAQDGTTWGNWRTLLDTSNYTDTLDGRYLRHAALNGGLIPVETVTTWGDSRGETVAEWADATAACAFKFKRNNPASGQMSMLLDGTTYVYEGQYEVAAQGRANNFVHSGNEVTFAGVNTANMILWLNYRLASGTGSIGEYYLGAGTKGEFAALRARKYTSTVATGTQPFECSSTTVNANLNADLLDGLHSTAFARCDQWQRVDLDTLNGFGFMKNYANDDATPERHYPIKEAGLLIYGEAAYSSANQIYGSYRSNRWFARGGGGSPTDKTTWREFAFLDSNIASASKLANDAAFTAWGQTFFQNGVPRSVSGAMTGVGQITATTLAIATTYDNTWSDGTNSHPWYGYDHRFHNTGVYSTTISDFYGITLRTSAGYISMDADGRVGIGTTAPLQKLHVDGNVLVSGDAYYRTEGRAGNSWNNGYGALSVGIMHNGSQTPLLVAYRYNGGTWTTPTTDRLFAMELLNYGTQLRFGFGGATKFYFDSDGTFHSENGIWSEGYVSALGQNTSSDERLKRIIRPITLTVDEIAKAPIYVFEWINGAGIEIGSIAQYWQSVLPEGVRSRKDSYLSMSGNLGLVAAICNARHISDHARHISDHARHISDHARHISDHARRIAALERYKSKLEDDNRALKEENLEIKRQLQQLTAA